MKPLFFDSLDALPPATALAVGTFDGVHRGHQAILQQMLSVAHDTGKAPWVLTFEGAPTLSASSNPAPARIYDAALQTHYLLESGATLIRQPFTSAFSAISAADFLTRLKGAEVFCGDDWRFGKGAQGDIAFLKEHKIATHVVPYAQYKGERISSTRIRAALTAGAMDDATAMLGRPWAFCGVVQHGRALAGKTFGVPTLNLPYQGRAGEMLVPLAHGVYHGTATIHQANGVPKTYQALINFGTAPSIKGLEHPLFEVHLLDVSDDFYGCTVTLQIEKPRVRAERKFESLTALHAQILEDLAFCRENNRS